MVLIFLLAIAAEEKVDKAKRPKIWIETIQDLLLVPQLHRRTSLQRVHKEGLQFRFRCIRSCLMFNAGSMWCGWFFLVESIQSSSNFGTGESLQCLHSLTNGLRLPSQCLLLLSRNIFRTKAVEDGGAFLQYRIL